MMARTGSSPTSSNARTMATRDISRKTDIDCPKSSWHPSPLIGQVVLVSSISARGRVHAARKSWITMVSEHPPMLGLCCRLSHRTAINILETRDFVVNIPGGNLVPRLWKDSGRFPAAREDETGDWTFGPSTKVRAPRIMEGRAHIECHLDSTKRLGEEDLMFFARIVTVSVDQALLRGALAQRYRNLEPVFYLEEGFFGLIDSAHKIPE
ncbi:MAG: flavin reductase family protein [Acidobacteriota bacterium]